MSTRSQIMVRENEKCKIYKHSDGYPEGVLDVLVPTVETFKEYRGWDPEYLTARILMAFALNEEEQYRAYRTKGHEWASEPRVTGFGLDSGWHGDIEFAYIIEPDFTINVHCLWGSGGCTPTKKNIMVKSPPGTSLVKALGDCKTAVDAYDE
jgi:hypothetical protein